MKEQLMALDKKQGNSEIKNSKLTNRLMVVIVTYFFLSFFFSPRESQPLFFLHTFTDLTLYKVCIKTF